MKYRWYRGVLYYLLIIARLFVLLLPYKIALWLGSALGNIAYYLVAKQRRLVLKNLAFAYGNELSQAGLGKIARGVFRNLARVLAELISFPKINKGNINRLVRMHNLHRIDEALSRGRGYIMLATHLGNWELLGAALTLNGYHGKVVARRIYYRGYDRLLSEMRRSKGVEVLYRDQDGTTKEILRLLKTNQAIGLLPDQDVDSVRGIFVNFYGRPAYTPTGPAAIARKAGAPIVLCLMIWNGEGYDLFIEEPIEVRESDDEQDDIKAATEKWMSIVESYIRKHPDQWVWMHNRWKTKAYEK